jgi:hypothetical protein
MIDNRSRVQRRDQRQCAWGRSKVITAMCFRRLACSGAVSLLVRATPKRVGLDATSRRRAYRNYSSNPVEFRTKILRLFSLDATSRRRAYRNST